MMNTTDVLGVQLGQQDVVLMAGGLAVGLALGRSIVTKTRSHTNKMNTTRNKKKDKVHGRRGAAAGLTRAEEDEIDRLVARHGKSATGMTKDKNSTGVIPLKEPTTSSVSVADESFDNQDDEEGDWRQVQSKEEKDKKQQQKKRSRVLQRRQVEEQKAVPTTWQARRNSDEGVVALKTNDLRCLESLLCRYPHIVYLGYSFWRKLVMMKPGEHADITNTTGGKHGQFGFHPDGVNDSGFALGTIGALKSLAIPRLILASTKLTIGGVTRIHYRERQALTPNLLVKVQTKLDRAKLLQHWEEGKSRYWDDFEEEWVEETWKSKCYVPSRFYDFDAFLVATILNNQLDVMSLILSKLRPDLNHDDWQVFMRPYHPDDCWQSHYFHHAAEGDYKTSFLHVAAQYGTVEMVRMLVLQGLATTDIVSWGENAEGITVVDAAIDGGNTEIVRFLLEVGASANSDPSELRGTIFKAVQGKRSCGVSMVRVLLAYGAAFDLEMGRFCPLEAAVTKGDVEIIEILLSHIGGEAPLAQTPDQGQKLLQEASKKKKRDQVAAVLKQYGASLKE